MPNGRCRMHGGPSTGATTPEGRQRCREAVTKHGFYSNALKAERREARLALRRYRDFVAQLDALDH